MTAPAAPGATAHRGDSELYPENTLPAVRSAAARGADFIEIDIQVTADGEVIVVHDPTLERIWGLPRPVSQVGLAEVIALGDAEHRPPLLAEVLAAVRDASSVLLIDVTDARMIPPAMRVVRAAAHGPVAWCGDLEAMRVVRALDPQARVWMPWAAITPPTTADVGGLAPEVLNVPALVATPVLVAAAHDLGMRVAAWTVDDAADMRVVLDSGVDLVTTNRLAALQTVLAGADDRPPSPSRYERERAVARGLGEWAIEFTRSADPGDIRTKRDAADIVTDVDVAVERYVREVIGAHFPDHAFVGEELGGADDGTAPCWYLDPVDGTANFANRIPWTAFSLALVVGGEPVVGIVADPWRGDLFDAERGAGARLNGEPLRLPEREAGDDPLRGRTVSTELANQSPWPGMLPLLQRLGSRFCTMRIMGSGTLSVVGVAAGRGVGAVIGSFGPVDHLAAMLVVAEAGGVVWDEDGAPNLFPHRGGLLAAAPAAASDLYALWSASVAEAADPAAAVREEA